MAVLYDFIYKIKVKLQLKIYRAGAIMFFLLFVVEYWVGISGIFLYAICTNITNPF